jgi:hypothetical protein
MQAFDPSGNLLETRQLDEEEVGPAVQDAMSKPNVQNVSVGRLPRKGDVITISGLHFDVVFVDQTHGVFKMKIRKPK